MLIICLFSSLFIHQILGRANPYYIIPDNLASSMVLDSDVELQAPNNQFGTITITDYKKACECSNPEACNEPPDYPDWNGDNDDFYDRTLEEQTTARVGAMMLLTRGCYSTTSNSGPGDCCPLKYTKMLEAIKRANQESVTKIGLFDDTVNSWAKVRNHVEHLPDHTPFDFGDRNAWKYVYDYNWKLFFQTIPSSMWYRLDGKPVIAMWALRPTEFPVNRGSIKPMLDWIKQQFLQDFGVEPALIPPVDIFDSTTVQHSDVHCMHDWFSSASKISYRMTELNGRTCGAMCPGYRTSCTLEPCPSHSSTCLEIPRNNGRTLSNGLSAAHNATFALLEGWNDVRENAGYYRSKAWSTPSLYIDTIRKYADPAPVTLRLQAETADFFFDKSPENLGGVYRQDGLDVGRHENGGWFVGWTEAGEWIQFPNIQLGCGIYRFTAHCSSDREGMAIRLDIPGLPSVKVAPTGFSEYRHYHLGEVKLTKGVYAFKILFETGNVNIDWFFIKKSQSLDCD